MQIYDSTTIAFSRKCEAFLKEILQSLGFSVFKSRFKLGNFLYPLRVVVFEGTEWGHFNASYLQIGLNRKLIYLAKDSVVRDILKHELAHYLTYIKFPETSLSPHGPEFKKVCEELGFSPDISRATMELHESNLSKVGDLQSEKIIEKVKKLLSLAESSNQHEAELATLKANEILLKHNLNYVGSDSETLYLDRLLPRKRKDIKLAAIYEILKHFIVRPVISQGKNTCCLEVSGTLTNVKLAGYVANFLDKELDHLWEITRKEKNLSGLKQKNSFFLGVAEGFDQKMKTSKSTLKSEDQKSLVLLEKNLIRSTEMIYRRLGTSRTSHETDQRAKDHGVEKGKNLSVRNAVEGKSKKLYLPV